jgi:hypothetical protein
MSFFQLKKVTPNHGFVLIECGLRHSVFRPDISDVGNHLSFPISAIANMGWILYFDKSQRIACTFTE